MSVGCLSLFAPTHFHLYNGKCNFTQNNRSLTQSVSGFEMNYHNSGFGFIKF